MNVNVYCVLPLAHLNMMNKLVLDVVQYKEIHSEFLWIIFIVFTDTTEATESCYTPLIKICIWT